MYLSEWSGAIGFATAIIGSILVCWAILRHKPQDVNTSGNVSYDRLVMRSILPKGSGVPIDKVAETIKGQELGSFSLVKYKEKNENAS